MEHICDHDLERYRLGMITGERELAPLEEHLLTCALCLDRLVETERYVLAMRSALRIRSEDTARFHIAFHG